MRNPAEIINEADKCAEALNALCHGHRKDEVETLHAFIADMYDPSLISKLSRCSREDREEAIKQQDKEFQRITHQINRMFTKVDSFPSIKNWWLTFSKARALMSSFKSLYAEAKAHFLRQSEVSGAQKVGVINDPEKAIKASFIKDITAYLNRVAPDMNLVDTKHLSQHFSVMKEKQAINQMGTIYLARFLLDKLNKRGETIASVFGKDLKRERMKLMKKHGLIEGPNCGFFSRIQFGEIRSSEFKSIIARAQEFLNANHNQIPNHRR